MKAIKLIETKDEGEYYTNRYHRIDIPVELFDLKNLISDVGADEDGETAYFTYGVSWFFDDSIYSVDVTDLCEGVEGFYEDDEMPAYVTELILTLKKYLGYTLYPEEKPNT
jgi:hypothetical protein